MTVITFSREAHNGTQDLARLVARRLGYRYVGRDELTQAVTARSGVERVPQTVESEGRALSRWEQLGEQLTGDREAYFAALKAVVTELAVADNVVIVGHAAGQFLRDMRSVVRVFVVAPRQDRESAAYVRYLFGIDWLDPHEWDLVINTGRASPEAALEMVVHYTQNLVRDQAEHADLTRMELVSRIEERLLADRELAVDKLRVRVDSGRIVIEGEALTQADRRRAESVARSLAPEAMLDNQIALRPPTSA